MIIIHKVNDLLFQLFPKAIEQGKSMEALKEALIAYYTFGPFRPKVEIDGEFVKIEIDTSTITSQKAEFDAVVKHCERGNFSQAKPILERLIKKNPTNSEYYRILGQILSEERNIDGAVNNLHNALRWNSKNAHALTMLGNIFARNMNDIPTAMTYFEQALSVKPDDNIAINNIGANMMQLGRSKEAEQYFHRAYAINPNYPQTLYALAMVSNTKSDYLTALDYIRQTGKNLKQSDPMYNHTFELANEVCKKAMSKTDPMEMFNEYSSKLANASGKNIDLIQDDSIPTPAKMEIAENYNHDKHVIRYKKDRQGIAHLLMHELGHLDLTVQGRKKGSNYLFVATKEQKELFIRNNESTIVRLNKKGLDDVSVAGYINSLFHGMNSQIYNVPLDLFIEDFLYKTYPSLRPFQFISLLELLREYIAVSRSKEIAQDTPIFIRTATIILSLVNAHQFRDLYGFDLSNEFEATSQQLKISKELYSEYLKYQKGDRALDAHELIRQWAKKLSVEGYFSLIEESEFRASKMSSAAESDNDINPERQAPQKAQVDFAKEPAGQSAVTMYMLVALQHFNGMPQEKIKEIGFEIGLLGQKGIDHENMEQRYYLKSIPDKEFTGLQILSYMYVAFQFIDPTLEMGLNFNKEFEAAKGLFESGKK